MMKKIRVLTITAMLTGLTAALLYISSTVPTLRLTLIAAAGLISAAAVLECGLRAGVMVYAASSVIGLLLSPWNTLLYILFFGYYPIVKSLYERIKNAVVIWGVKIAAFNAVMTAVLVIYKMGVGIGIEIPEYGIYVLYIGANVSFVIYDVGMTRLIYLYMSRIKGRGWRQKP